MPRDRQQRPVSSSARAPEAEAGPGGSGGADAPGGPCACALVQEHLQILTRLVAQIAYNTSPRNVELDVYLQGVMAPHGISVGKGHL
jgi:hypothetical protein